MSADELPPLRAFASGVCASLANAIDYSAAIDTQHLQAPTHHQPSPPHGPIVFLSADI